MLMKKNLLSGTNSKDWKKDVASITTEEKVKTENARMQTE